MDIQQFEDVVYNKMEVVMTKLGQVVDDRLQFVASHKDGLLLNIMNDANITVDTLEAEQKPLRAPYVWHAFGSIGACFKLRSRYKATSSLHLR